MKPVAKYNSCKAMSTMLTIGSPIITLASCSELFVHKSGTAISAAGMFAILIALLFAKDKIAENFKMPSALVVAITGFVLVTIVENLLAPVKMVCIVTMITAGVDELTFKQWYKSAQALLPDRAEVYKKFGFIFTTSGKLEG